MEITFLGAAGTVTGSCYLVEVGGRRVMVDCGMYQGLPELEERNYTHPAVDWSSIDAILLTHAHIDHSGLLPRAVKLGFRGPIYSHPATVDLSEILLIDTAELQKHDAEWLSRKRMRAGKPPVQPLFDRFDVVRTLRHFRRVEYEDPVGIVPGVVAEFHDAGHILGSASIALDLVENDLKRRVVFSGDIGHHQAPILREPLGFDNADAVLVESTYGDRLHDPPKKRYEILRSIILEANRSRGRVLIPSFAVGRTQELLYILSEMLDHDEIPHMPIYLDSPMAIAATEVHERHPECFDPETLARIKSGENPFHPGTLHVSRTVAQSRSINRRTGSMIIIAGGGMCEGGRIVHHLKHGLFDSRNHLVFVGYQAVGTLGRVIQSGARRLKLLGEQIAVNAKITTIDSFSAHADQQGLIDWLRFLEKPPQVVFIIHGEEKGERTMAEKVRETLGFIPYIPRLNQKIDLSDLSSVAVGKRVFAETATPRAGDVRNIAARLSMVGDELRPAVDHYVAGLAKRIGEARESDEEPRWKPEEISEAQEYLADAVGGDAEKLQTLLRPPPTK
jgi:metallo-beta-lactamase family protein